jgi:hypothetical protein
MLHSKEEGVSREREYPYSGEIARMTVRDANLNVQLLSVADFILHRFTMTGFKRYVRHYKDRSNDHLRVLLASIRAPNIHDSNVYGVRCDAGLLASEVTTRPEYIDKFVRTNYPDAVYQMDNAFISGAGVSGFYTAYRKFIQDGSKISLDWSIFLTAYYRMRCAFNVKSFRPLEINRSTYDQLDLPKWKIGGVYGGTVINMNGEGKISTAGTLTRHQLRDLTVEQMVTLYTDWKAGKATTYDHFPKPICATCRKPECFPAGSDPNKVRIINLVGNEKVAWDAYLCRNYHKQLYHSKVVGIGHKWRAGGAYSLYRYMEADIPNKWTYVTLDISRLDKNMRENLIAFLAYDVSQYVEGDDFHVYLSRCLATMTAVRHLLWHGKAYTDKPHVIKLVQGSISSGELGTSVIDTSCGLLLNFAFDEFVLRCIEGSKDMVFRYFDHNFTARFSLYSASAWREQFKVKRRVIGKTSFVERPYAPMVDYGDDLLRGWYSSFDGLLLYKHKGKTWPLLFMWFIKKFFCLSAKDEEVDVYQWGTDGSNPFITTLDKGKPVKFGPKYLQRRFIRVVIKDGTERILPWRILDDYYAKTTVRTSRSFEPVIYLSVIRGLKFDTMGTNRAAFDYLDALETRHLEEYPACANKLAIMMTDEQFVEKNNILHRLKKVGLSESTLLLDRLDMRRVLSFFWYSDPELTYDNFVIGELNL